MPTPRTLPPVELSPPSLQAARVAHLRLAHNALAVSLLASRNVPRLGVDTQAPNRAGSVRAGGGREVQVLESLRARITEAETRHALALPGSSEQGYYASQLERLDRHVAAITAQLASLDAGPRISPGERDTYIVLVPALHARVEGVLFVAESLTLTVTADPGTPGYAEYLGRGEHEGHGATGKWPLWRPYGTRMRSGSEAEDWHFVLIAQLWPHPPLRPLLEAVPLPVADCPGSG